MTTQYQDLRRGKLFFDPPGSLEPIKVRHTCAHDHQSGAVQATKFYNFLTVFGLSNYLKVWLGLEHQPHRLPLQRVAVSDD
jgi:hypothetical protein